MSWGRSASGTATEIKAAMALWGPDVAKTDASYTNTDETAAGLHQGQVTRVVAAITAFVENAPDGYSFSVTGGGHGGTTREGIVTDQWNASQSAYLPAVLAY